MFALRLINKKVLDIGYKTRYNIIEYNRNRVIIIQLKL